MPHAGQMEIILWLSFPLRCVSLTTEMICHKQVAITGWHVTLGLVDFGIGSTQQLIIEYLCARYWARQRSDCMESQDVSCPGGASVPRLYCLVLGTLEHFSIPFLPHRALTSLFSVCCGYYENGGA